MSLPIGYRHTHTITRGGMFRKDKPTVCDYCETESYWREQIARELEARTIRCNDTHCGGKAFNEGITTAAKIARGEVK